jgi:hypothetical protein
VRRRRRRTVGWGEIGSGAVRPLPLLIFYDEMFLSY